MIDFQQYQSLAMRTAKNLDWDENLIHSALGLSGEAGEFADAVKKHLIYGQPFDKLNAIEEVGDLLWYVALACKALGVDIEHVAFENVKKLQRRYPDRYSDSLAAARLDKGE
jgi:NTP pyrophosphatase (non-canonical NTP hydrolase)